MLGVVLGGQGDGGLRVGKRGGYFVGGHEQLVQRDGGGKDEFGLGRGLAGGRMKKRVRREMTENRYDCRDYGIGSEVGDE